MTDMDRSEQERLEDDINRGVRNVGIYKVDKGALEKENRSPLVKGGGIGLGIGGMVAVAYGQNVGVHGMSPLGLFSDDYVLVMLGMIIGATAMGALIAMEIGKDTAAPETPPKDAP